MGRRIGLILKEALPCPGGFVPTQPQGSCQTKPFWAQLPSWKEEFGQTLRRELRRRKNKGPMVSDPEGLSKVLDIREMLCQS